MTHSLLENKAYLNENVTQSHSAAIVIWGAWICVREDMNVCACGTGSGRQRIRLAEVHQHGSSVSECGRAVSVPFDPHLCLSEGLTALTPLPSTL